MNIAFCLSLFLTCTTSTPRVREPLLTIPIDVVAPSDISESFLKRMCAEAEAIWGPAGVRFAWRRLNGVAGPHGPRLTVVVENDDRPIVDRRTALGWIMFKTNVPDPTIHLSRGSADQLLFESGGVDTRTLGTYEMMMARALGRALSHELGHYLLKSRQHTRRGLMRALWPSPELFAIHRGGFALTAAERAAATCLLSEAR